MFDLSTYDKGKVLLVKPIPAKVDSFYNSPSTLVKELDRFVVGQESAKKALAVTVINNQVILDHFIKTKEQLHSSNLLLIGPSGSGKTLLMQTLGKLLDRDILIVDITQFTVDGYVGRSCSDILIDLQTLCNENIERMQKAIIFIDEVDKISTGDMDADVSTMGVQRSLLKMIEGGKRFITSASSGGSRRGEDNQRINLDNILWVFGGAFTSLFDKESNSEKGIGFGKGNKGKKEVKITHEDLIKNGLMREFVGRIGQIVQLHPITKEMYRDILTKPENSITIEYEKLGKLRGLDLTLSEEDIDAIVNEATELGIGARGLRILAETKLINKMYC